MRDGETEESGTTVLLRRLRPLIGEPEARAGWRDDLRLFAVTWAAGFLFFLIFLA